MPHPWLIVFGATFTLLTVFFTFCYTIWPCMLRRMRVRREAERDAWLAERDAELAPTQMNLEDEVKKPPFLR